MQALGGPYEAIKGPLALQGPYKGIYRPSQNPKGSYKAIEALSKALYGPYGSFSSVAVYESHPFQT